MQLHMLVYSVSARVKNIYAQIESSTIRERERERERERAQRWVAGCHESRIICR